MSASLPLMKHLLAPFAKSVLLPLELKAAVSETNAAIQKNIFASGMSAMKMSNEEMEDIMKIVKSLEESGLLMNGVSETIKNKVKKQKGGFLPMLLGTLAASTLGNMLVGRRAIRSYEGTTRASQNL